MALPTTYLAAIVVAVLTMLCWGLWPNTLKIARKRRFELYSFDFAIGFAIMAVLAMATFGTFGADVTTVDNLVLVRRLEIFQASVAGVALALGNLFLLGGITLCGMSFAAPVVLSISMVVTALWKNSGRATLSGLLLYSGVAVVAIAVIVAAQAYGTHLAATRQAAVPGKKKPAQASALKGTLLCVAGGFVMGWVQPLVEISRRGQIPINPYSIALAMIPMLIGGTMLFSLYFFNLPVQGNALSYLAYLKGGLGVHTQGLIGGALWCVGIVGYGCIMESTTGTARILQYCIGPGAILLAALSGVVVWKEYSSSPKERLLILIAALGTIAGTALIAAA